MADISQNEMFEQGVQAQLGGQPPEIGYYFGALYRLRWFDGYYWSKYLRRYGIKRPHYRERD